MNESKRDQMLETMGNEGFPYVQAQDHDQHADEKLNLLVESVIVSNRNITHPCRPENNNKRVKTIQ